MKKSVWVVDDQQDILDVVQIVLESEGFAVKTFLNSSFLQLAEHELPDIILLDILLSGEDGRDLCRTLKNRQATRRVPVVLLSAHFDASKALEGCGADGFLAKPFHLDELISIVREHLTPI